MTSREVVDEGRRVTRIHRLHSGSWMVLSAVEGEASEPIWVHYEHVLEADPTAVSAPALAKGQYAMRSFTGDVWHVFGPVSDRLLDDLLDGGMVDIQHETLVAREGEER